jgi:transposase
MPLTRSQAKATNTVQSIKPTVNTPIAITAAASRSAVQPAQQSRARKRAQKGASRPRHYDAFETDGPIADCIIVKLLWGPNDIAAAAATSPNDLAAAATAGSEDHIAAATATSPAATSPATTSPAATSPAATSPNILVAAATAGSEDYIAAAAVTSRIATSPADPAATSPIATSPDDPADPSPIAANCAQQRANSTIAIRIQALSLYDCGQSTNQALEKTGLKRRTYFDILKRAKERGWARGLPITEAFVIDLPRSGRPIIVNQERGEEVISELTRNSTTRQYSLQQLCDTIGQKKGWKISRATLYRWLKKQGYRNVKLTTKPGLTIAQRLARLQFAWLVKDWPLEMWKKVIWSDETAVVLGAVRGKRRVWRLPYEACNRHNIRFRWKGRKEFMVWGCLSYDYKGPCHIWHTETAAQKKVNDATVAQWNEENEPRLREAWELSNSLRRMNLDRKGRPRGRKPQFNWNKAAGKKIRSEKRSDGIDGTRYRNEVLKEQYFPFLRALPGSNWIAQEDNAGPHASEWNRDLWREEGFLLLDWPPNSPDLSPIEPYWYFLKARISKQTHTKARKEMEKAWQETWKAVPQACMQQFVERVPHHIDWVLRCKGDNNYKEGSTPPDLTSDERESLYLEIEALLAGKPFDDEIEEIDDAQWDLPITDLISLLRR